MSGEFRGDFSRLPFDPRKGYSSLHMQQGRVQLDADWNEQVATLLHTIRTLAEDLIGGHGGPIARAGFRIFNINYSNGEVTDFDISSGHYYVCGILCDNRFVWKDNIQNFEKVKNVNYKRQPFYPLSQDKKFPIEQPLLVYLDVWEREITYLQDASLREVALGGPDTTTRSQVVWQVKIRSPKNDDTNNGNGLNNIQNCQNVIDNWDKLLNEWQPAQRGEIKVSAKIDEPQTEPCTINPESSYQGPENQLYRVEIHSPGNANEATFKWSRENGSVAYTISPGILSATGLTTEIILETWWNSEDDPRALKKDDCIEIVNEDYILLQKADPLWKISEINREEQKIQLTRKCATDTFTFTEDPRKPLMLRRWDGFGNVEELTSEWLPLENGIKIQFQSNDEQSHYYRTGDYWVIPARVATDDVEWPKCNNEPVALPPHGIRHHYAPLAIIKSNTNGDDVITLDCRRQFHALARTDGNFGPGQGVGTDLIFPDACEEDYSQTERSHL